MINDDWKLLSSMWFILLCELQFSTFQIFCISNTGKRNEWIKNNYPEIQSIIQKAIIKKWKMQKVMIPLILFYALANIRFTRNAIIILSKMLVKTNWYCCMLSGVCHSVKNEIAAVCFECVTIVEILFWPLNWIKSYFMTLKRSDKILSKEK